MYMYVCTYMENYIICVYIYTHTHTHTRYMYIKCPCKLHTLLFGSVCLFTWRSLYRCSCCFRAFPSFVICAIVFPLCLHCFVLSFSLRCISPFRSFKFLVVNYVFIVFPSLPLSLLFVVISIVLSFVHTCFLSLFISLPVSLVPYLFLFVLLHASSFGFPSKLWLSRALHALIYV